MLVQFLKRIKGSKAEKESPHTAPVLRRLCLTAVEQQRKVLRRFFLTLIEKVTFPISEASNMKMYLQILKEENVSPIFGPFDWQGGDERGAELDPGADELRADDQQLCCRRRAHADFPNLTAVPPLQLHVPDPQSPTHREPGERKCGDQGEAEEQRPIYRAARGRPYASQQKYFQLLKTKSVETSFFKK